MQISRILMVASLALILAACSSKPVIVQYKVPADASSDWYPIPEDAPSSVEVASPLVPKITAFIAEEDIKAGDRELEIVEFKDSIGNTSLRLNRNTGTAWELIGMALTELEYEIDDKDRDSYRFLLKSAVKKRGLFGFLFKSKDEQINIVLVPQAGDTVVVVEGEGDEIPDSKRVESILNALQDHFRSQS